MPYRENQASSWSKEKRMKKIFIVLGLAFVVVFALNIPYLFPSFWKDITHKNTVPVEPERIESVDGLFAMELPYGWESTEAGTLNALSCLEALDIRRELYFAAIMEKKADFDLDLVGYRDRIVTYNEGLSGSSFGEPTATTVGEYEAYSYEFYSTTPDGVNLYMILYVIETDNYFGQLYSWTERTMEMDYKEELGNVVHTFTEESGTADESNAT